MQRLLEICRMAYGSGNGISQHRGWPSVDGDMAIRKVNQSKASVAKIEQGSMKIPEQLLDQKAFGQVHKGKDSFIIGISRGYHIHFETVRARSRGVPTSFQKGHQASQLKNFVIEMVICRPLHSTPTMALLPETLNATRSLEEQEISSQDYQETAATVESRHYSSRGQYCQTSPYPSYLSSIRN